MVSDVGFAMRSAITRHRQNKKHRLDIATAMPKREEEFRIRMMDWSLASAMR